ncbi:MAG: hypothetical protein Q4E51_06635 [Lachnospiraceae bacterium]|nr:hypothetical protein [Lachnospiraceae bacterium]
MKKDQRILFIDFLIIFFSIILINIFFNPNCNQYYDSWKYWDIGKGFLKGDIELLRGYFFPGFLGLLYGVFGDYSQYIWVVFSALLEAFYFVYITSVLWDNNMSDKMVFRVGRYINYLVILILFSGLFYYTLSDLWTFIFASSSLAIIKLLNKTNLIKYNIVYCFIFGMLLYISYNIRTIYLFFSVGALVLLIISLRKSFTGIKSLICFITTVLGTFVSALPQFILNRKVLGLLSFKVQTTNLFSLQLIWGTAYQQYATYIGDEVDNPCVFFIDPVGQNVLSSVGIKLNATEVISGMDSISIISYFKMVLTHPMEYVGIYFRHLVNMLFPMWPSQYVNNFNNNKIPYAIISFTLFYLFVLVLLKRCYLSFYNQIILLPILLPVIAITPGAVESRYFLPLFYYMAGTVCLNTDYNKLLDEIKGNKLQHIVVFVCIFLLFVSIWSTMLASYSGPIDIHI